MNSITTAVEVTYDERDVPQPRFRCPVGIDAQVVKFHQQTSNPLSDVINAAACAVELVSRFEAYSRYVDFAHKDARLIDKYPIALRVHWVNRAEGVCVQIALIQSGTLR